MPHRSDPFIHNAHVLFPMQPGAARTTTPFNGAATELSKSFPMLPLLRLALPCTKLDRHNALLGRTLNAKLVDLPLGKLPTAILIGNASLQVIRWRNPF